MKTTVRFIIGLDFIAVLSIMFLDSKWSIFTTIISSILGLACLYFAKSSRRKSKKPKVSNRSGKKYHSMCKAQKHLSNTAENYKNEYKKLKLEKRHWEESQIIFNNNLKEARERFQLELKKKDRHIVHLTKRNAKLESAETAWKEKLDLKEEKINRLKRDGEEKLEEISDLERMKDDEITSLRERLSDMEAELEDTAKRLLVAEEMNHQLCAQRQIEEVLMIKKFTLHHSLRHDTSDLSNGYDLNIEDSPPESFDKQCGGDIIVENYKLLNFKNIVSGDSINNTEYYDRCQLSSDSADPLGTIPSSAYSIRHGVNYN